MVSTRPAPLPVAYLPGASGRASALSPIAERLASRRPPILVDYPGLSGVPSDPSIGSLDDLCAHVAARLPERVDVVALSMGGAVALRFVLAHPRRVRRLVLVMPAGGVDARRFGGVDWRPTFSASHPDAPPWFVGDDTDLTSRLGEVSVPTLLVFGGRDLIAPLAVGEHLFAHLPRAHLEIIPEATHDLEAEFPDLLSSLVEAHLRR